MTFSNMKTYLGGIGCFMLQYMTVGPSVFALGNHSCRNAGGGSSKKRTALTDDQSVGGQAVIEGVMMRSPRRIATAVRKPDKKIFTKNDPYVALSKRHKL
ncbi:MAG: hypothetical protein P8Y09_05735, partial [Deltaproteobacteria bacterium]